MPLSIKASSDAVKNQLAILNKLQSRLSPSSLESLALSQSRPDIIQKIARIHQKQNQSLLSLIPAIFDMLVAKL